MENQYEPLLDVDVSLPQFDHKDLPVIEPQKVYEYLLKIKTTTTTVLNDIPAKVIKLFAKHLCKPLAYILNTSIKNGEFPEIWKLEQVSPIPKVYPTTKINQLRKI